MHIVTVIWSHICIHTQLTHTKNEQPAGRIVDLYPNTFKKNICGNGNEANGEI